MRMLAAGMFRKQTGQAMLLVLAVLGVGAAVIAPTLRYAGTALKSQTIMQDVLVRQYAADAGVEDGIWRVRNNIDGLRDQLSLANPSYAYQLTMNGVTTDITAGIPPVLPDSDHSNPPGNPERLYAYIERNVKWLPPAGGAATYSLQIVPVGSAVSWGRELRAVLPPGFAYAAGTSAWTRTTSGTTENLADPVIQVIGSDTWYVWDIPGAWEKIGKAPDTATLQFGASVGAVDGGIYYSKAKVLYAGQGQQDPDQFTVGNSAPIWIAGYQVSVQAETVRATSFFILTQGGEASVFNWLGQ